MVWEEMLFEEFQDGRHGGHLGYRNKTILAVLNLCVTVMPSWISERNDFSNSESLCHCEATNQVLAQSDLRFGGDAI